MLSSPHFLHWLNATWAYNAYLHKLGFYFWAFYSDSLYQGVLWVQQKGALWVQQTSRCVFQPVSFGARVQKEVFFKCEFLKLILFLSVLGLCGCVGFSLVVPAGGYSSLQYASFHCSGLSRCRARALGTRASGVTAHMLSSCGAWA